jgi:hypothetical protein
MSRGAALFFLYVSTLLSPPFCLSRWVRRLFSPPFDALLDGTHRAHRSPRGQRRPRRRRPDGGRSDFNDGRDGGGPDGGGRLGPRRPEVLRVGRRRPRRGLRPRSALSRRGRVPPGGALLRRRRVLPGGNAFGGSHDLPEAVGAGHPPDIADRALVADLFGRGGRQGGRRGGRRRRGGVGRRRDAVARRGSPTTTPPPAVGGTPSPDGSTWSPTATSPLAVAADGTIAPTLSDETIPPRNRRFWPTGAVACNA